MIDDRVRLIAAFVFMDLLGAWLWFSYRAAKQDATGRSNVTGAERPRIGLHDDPRLVLAQAERPRPERIGEPPPLR